jgi:hypothetical protein
MRIVICGGPRTGKTTLATSLVDAGHFVGCGRRDLDILPVRHTDDLIPELQHLGKDAWSEGSRRVSEWLDAPGPWIIEGVSVCRALRKWREAHPGASPPVDKIFRLIEPHETLSKGQAAMAKGEETVWLEIEPWLFRSDGPVVFHAEGGR